MTVFRASFVGSDEEEVLITGGGDGAIKVWGLAHLWSEGLVQIHKFKTPAHSVLSLAHSGPFLYAGLSDGGIYIYNLSSQQLVQRLAVPYGDLNSIRVLGGVALCGTSRGWVKVSWKSAIGCADVRLENRRSIQSGWGMGGTQWENSCLLRCAR